jgi:hypothetical protein
MASRIWRFVFGNRINVLDTASIAGPVGGRGAMLFGVVLLSVEEFLCGLRPEPLLGAPSRGMRHEQGVDSMRMARAE